MKSDFYRFTVHGGKGIFEVHKSSIYVRTGYINGQICRPAERSIQIYVQPIQVTCFDQQLDFPKHLFTDIIFTLSLFSKLSSKAVAAWPKYCLHHLLKGHAMDHLDLCITALNLRH